MLFLYSITQRQTWYVISSPKTILIEKDGIIKNFNEVEIDKLNADWLAIKAQVDYTFLTRKIERMRKEFDRPEPKDGDVWEWGNSASPFKEMKF